MQLLEVRMMLRDVLYVLNDCGYSMDDFSSFSQSKRATSSEDRSKAQHRHFAVGQEREDLVTNGIWNVGRALPIASSSGLVNMFREVLVATLDNRSWAR
jgi:hypothetical protein